MSTFARTAGAMATMLALTGCAEGDRDLSGNELPWQQKGESTFVLAVGAGVAESLSRFRGETCLEVHAIDSLTYEKPIAVAGPEREENCEPTKMGDIEGQYDSQNSWTRYPNGVYQLDLSASYSEELQRFRDTTCLEVKAAVSLTYSKPVIVAGPEMTEGCDPNE